MKKMKTLVYKRTHNGDPDIHGQFGIYDCMKSVRAWPYEAVIGVGGIGPEPRRKGIAEKLTWVGIGPHRTGRPDRPLVTFDRFLYYGEEGPRLDRYAPSLANHIYGRNVRTLMSLTDREQAEVNSILALAKNVPPSRALNGQKDRGKTSSKSCKALVAGREGSGRSC
jgi:hypothetical protein